MKNKSLLIIVFLLLTVFLSSCAQAELPDDSSNPSSIVSSSITQKQILDNETEITVQPHTNNINEEGIGGGVMTVYKYRDMFYSVPAPFVNLVGREVFFAWRDTIDATSTAETMVMSQFIQHFGITREQFDRANLEWAKGIKYNLYGIPCINPKDYANQVTDEIFNGDIIFTFDDDLIREYYLSPDYPYIYDFEFEEAVANGEYTSQTEEWVDVEQMEAEINAKYGAPESTDAAD